jgi:hypothetical protein
MLIDLVRSVGVLITFASHGTAGLGFIAIIATTIAAWNMFRKNQCGWSGVCVFPAPKLKMRVCSGFYVANSIDIAEQAHEPIWSSLE